MLCLCLSVCAVQFLLLRTPWSSVRILLTVTVSIFVGVGTTQISSSRDTWTLRLIYVGMFYFMSRYSQSLLVRLTVHIEYLIRVCVPVFIFYVLLINSRSQNSHNYLVFCLNTTLATKTGYFLCERFGLKLSKESIFEWCARTHALLIFIEV